MSLAFFDTNILVYTDSASDSQKQKQASAIFREHFANRTAVLSLQVLQEYFAAVTRKLGVPADVAQRRVQNFSLAKIVRFKAADIIAASNCTGCRKFLSGTRSSSTLRASAVQTCFTVKTFKTAPY
jgi:predicted nucleic acid-binding protein